MIKPIRTRVFQDYPYAQEFIDGQLRRGRGCTLVVCNEGFLVDVYAYVQQKNREVIH